MILIQILLPFALFQNNFVVKVTEDLLLLLHRILSSFRTLTEKVLHSHSEHN